jgi:hypothetical protein
MVVSFTEVRPSLHHGLARNRTAHRSRAHCFVPPRGVEHAIHAALREAREIGSIEELEDVFQFVSDMLDVQLRLPTLELHCNIES